MALNDEHATADREESYAGLLKATTGLLTPAASSRSLDNTDTCWIHL